MQKGEIKNDVSFINQVNLFQSTTKELVFEVD